MLAASQDLIGERTVTVQPGPVNGSMSVLGSPPTNSMLTAGETLTVSVQPRDAFSNAAVPAAGQRLVAVAEYTAVGGRAAGAEAVNSSARFTMAKADGAGAYGPWDVEYVATVAGNVTFSVVLESAADGSQLAALGSASIQVLTSSVLLELTQHKKHVVAFSCMRDALEL